MDCPYITFIVFGKNTVVERLTYFFLGLNHSNIKSIKSYVVMKQKFNNLKMYILCHDKLGQFGSLMIRHIIKHSQEHPLKNKKILFSNEHLCVACRLYKLLL